MTGALESTAYSHVTHGIDGEMMKCDFCFLQGSAADRGHLSGSPEEDSIKSSADRPG